MNFNSDIIYTSTPDYEQMDIISTSLGNMNVCKTYKRMTMKMTAIKVMFHQVPLTKRKLILLANESTDLSQFYLIL